MFSNLVKDHLIELKSLQDKNLLIAYKGFPVEFVMQIAQDYPFLVNGNITTKDNRLNLKNILDNTTSLIRELIQKTKSTNIIFYEELLAIQKHLDLNIYKGKIMTLPPKVDPDSILVQGLD